MGSCSAGRRLDESRRKMISLSRESLFGHCPSAVVWIKEAHIQINARHRIHNKDTEHKIGLLTSFSSWFDSKDLLANRRRWGLFWTDGTSFSLNNLCPGWRDKCNMDRKDKISPFSTQCDSPGIYRFAFCLFA